MSLEAKIVTIYFGSIMPLVGGYVFDSMSLYVLGAINGALLLIVFLLGATVRYFGRASTILLLQETKQETKQETRQETMQETTNTSISSNKNIQDTSTSLLQEQEAIKAQIGSDEEIFPEETLINTVVSENISIPVVSTKKKKSSYMYSKSSLYVLCLRISGCLVVLAGMGIAHISIAIAGVCFAIIYSLFMAKAIRRKRIYIFKKLFLPKDYILVFSMYVFGGVLILLQDIQWWYSITLASCAAFVVSFVIIRWFLGLASSRFWRQGLPKLYVLMFVSGFVFSSFVVYRTADDLLAQSTDTKMGFVIQEVYAVVKNIQQNIQQRFEGTGTVQEQIIEDVNETLTFTGTTTGVIVDKISFQNTGSISTGLATTGSDQASISSSDIMSDIINETTSDTMTGSIDSDEQIQDSIPIEIESTNNELVSFRQAIVGLFVDPSVLTNNSYTFTNILSTDPDYKYFATAKSLSMIGTTIQPDKNVLCETYIVMKGLRRRRNVNVIDKKDPFSPYRDYALSTDQLQGCQKGVYVKKKNL